MSKLLFECLAPSIVHISQVNRARVTFEDVEAATNPAKFADVDKEDVDTLGRVLAEPYPVRSLLNFSRRISFRPEYKHQSDSLEIHVTSCFWYYELSSIVVEHASDQFQAINDKYAGKKFPTLMTMFPLLKALFKTLTETYKEETMSWRIRDPILDLMHVNKVQSNVFLGFEFDSDGKLIVAYLDKNGTRKTETVWSFRVEYQKIVNPTKKEKV